MLISLDANTEYDEDSGSLAERIPDKKIVYSYATSGTIEYHTWKFRSHQMVTLS